MSNKKSTHIQSIIVHLLLGLAILTGSFVLIFYNLFHNFQNQRLSPRELLSPSILKSMILYRNEPGVSCNMPNHTKFPFNEPHHIAWNQGQQIIAKQNGNRWSIVRKINGVDEEVLIENINFESSTLTRSYAVSNSIIMYPDCQNDGCYIKILDIDSKSTRSIPAFSEPGKTPARDIHQVFYDESRGLISYVVGESESSHRVVINTDLQLINSINELPHKDRHLEFKYYDQDNALLVYGDPHNNSTYFYKADDIGLYRRKC